MATRFMKSHEHRIGEWTIFTSESHILKSEGHELEEFEAALNLPHLPEMVFDANHLTLVHNPTGASLDFNALDALKMVDANQSSVTVAAAEEWRNARTDVECVSTGKVARPYDWTFTTAYKGTLTQKKSSSGDVAVLFQVEPTEEEIDLERLKKREKIEFLADMNLFEDELGDNGCSLLNVKLRAMPTSFFLLMRFYLRVDGRLVRIYDTRVFHDITTNYLLREFRQKESEWDDIHANPRVIFNVNEVDSFLNTHHVSLEKLSIPS